MIAAHSSKTIEEQAYAINDALTENYDKGINKVDADEKTLRKSIKANVKGLSEEQIEEATKVAVEEANKRRSEEAWNKDEH